MWRRPGGQTNGGTHFLFSGNMCRVAICVIQESSCWAGMPAGILGIKILEIFGTSWNVKHDKEDPALLSTALLSPHYRDWPPRFPDVYGVLKEDETRGERGPTVLNEPFCHSLQNDLRFHPNGSKHSFLCSTTNKICLWDLQIVVLRLTIVLFAGKHVVPDGSSSTKAASTVYLSTLLALVCKSV